MYDVLVHTIIWLVCLYVTFRFNRDLHTDIHKVKKVIEVKSAIDDKNYLVEVKND